MALLMSNHHHRQIAQTFYFSSSGGRTEDCKYVFGSSVRTFSSRDRRSLANAERLRRFLRFVAETKIRQSEAKRPHIAITRQFFHLV